MPNQNLNLGCRCADAFHVWIAQVLEALGDCYLLYWRVPVDDSHHWLFAMSFKQSGPIPEEYRRRRSWDLMTPNYHFTRNQGNRYLQDREEQRTSTFTGLGSVFVVQDALANESQRPIQDRTKETLGIEDMLIVAGRQLLLAAIGAVARGEDAPGVIRDPAVNAVDPIFLKRNQSPSPADLDEIRAESQGRWVAAAAR